VWAERMSAPMMAIVALNGSYDISAESHRWGHPRFVTRIVRFYATFSETNVNNSENLHRGRLIDENVQ
jgi:hypothetical protein